MSLEGCVSGAQKMAIYYIPVEELTGKQTPAIASAFKVHSEASAAAYSLAVVQR